MGAIQSAINSGMTTLAAGVGAAKKINTDVEKNKLEMESLKANKTIELADVKKRIGDINSEIKANKALTEAASKGLNMAETTYDPVNDTYIGPYDISATDKTISYNVAKQKQALKSLQGELTGLKMQRKTITNFLKGGKQ